MTRFSRLWAFTLRSGHGDLSSLELSMVTDFLVGELITGEAQNTCSHRLYPRACWTLRWRGPAKT
jgi:hypothetical protein